MPNGAVPAVPTAREQGVDLQWPILRGVYAPRGADPAFGDGLRLVVDADRIDALAADRAALWERVASAPFLTLNEKREAVGYAPVAGGDRLG